MDTAYLICALVGGTLVACQFLLTLLGLGGHHDAGGDHDISGHDAGGHDAAGHDTDHDQHVHSSAASWFLSVLTFRTLTAGGAFFRFSRPAPTKADAPFGGTPAAPGGAAPARGFSLRRGGED